MSQLTDDILSNVDIVDIVSRYVPLKRAGSNFSGNCPFHNEKTPSFMVSPAKQIFKCFGCGKGGNALTFMQEIERIDFWDTVKILAKDAHVDLKKYEFDPKKMEQHADEKQKIKRLHKLAQQFFQDQLKHSSEAMKYLTEERKLDQTMIDTFGIGYAPDNHYALIQHLKDKGFKDEDILQASLAKKGQGDSFGFFRNRIMFPIYDTMQNVVGFSARVLNPNDKPKYLNSSEHPAFEKSKILYGLNWTKNHIKEHQKIIVVEGQMDVIALHRLGFPIAVASSGTALTSEHMKLLKRYTENLYFLFDNDQAGQEATIRALKVAYQQNLYPKLITLPDAYKDADDVANETEGKEIFEKIIESAKDGFGTTLQQIKSQIDITSPVGKQKILNSMFGLVLNNDNIPMQDHYLHTLAETLGLAYEVLLPQYKQYAKTDGKFELRKNQNTPQQKLYQPDREIILAALLYQDFLLKYQKEDPERKLLYEFLITIGKLLPETQLSISQGSTLSDDLLENLSESQLRREKELESLNTEEKQLHMLKKTIAHTTQDYMKQINKLSPDQRDAIMNLKKKISWK